MNTVAHRTRYDVQYVEVGDDWQTLVTAAAVGATFIVRAGLHLHQAVTPKTNQSFLGEPGAIMSGGQTLTGPTGSNPWAYTGQTQHGTVLEGSEVYCEDGWSALCGNPEDVFLNDVPLEAVATLGAGSSGKYFFDYAANTIYIWDNPAGNVVTTSVTPQAFLPGTATGVLIRGLTIEKYANPVETYTVDMGSSWIVQDCEVRFNHFSGVRISDLALVKGCNIHHNGGFGMNGSGLNPVVEDNTIAYNNYAHVSVGWGAGGTKFVFTDGLICRRNWAHHNKGPGLWTDISNIRTLYDENLCEDNYTEGIFHEVSYDAVIRNNVCNRNGTSQLFPGYVSGAGILVSGSRNVEVYGNTCLDNWQGIAGLDPDRSPNDLETDGPWELVNLDVHDNTVTQTTDFGANGTYGVSGVVSNDAAGLGTFTTSNNQYTHNTYVFGSDTLHFNWDGNTIAKAAWQAAGHDTTGTFTP